MTEAEEKVSCGSEVYCEAVHTEPLVSKGLGYVANMLNEIPFENAAYHRDPL
jgi:hypothetical protein